MYLKLKGVEFKNADMAIEAARKVIDYGPSVDCYYRRIPGDTGWKKEVIWTVRVPAGRNCSALIKHLKDKYPRSDWVLFDIDEDGFEVCLQPSSNVADLRAALIPVRA